MKYIAYLVWPQCCLWTPWKLKGFCIISLKFGTKIYVLLHFYIFVGELLHIIYSTAIFLLVNYNVWFTPLLYICWLTTLYIMVGWLTTIYVLYICWWTTIYNLLHYYIYVGELQYHYSSGTTIYLLLNYCIFSSWGFPLLETTPSVGVSFHSTLLICFIILIKTKTETQEKHRKGHRKRKIQTQTQTQTWLVCLSHPRLTDDDDNCIYSEQCLIFHHQHCKDHQHHQRQNNCHQKNWWRWWRCQQSDDSIYSGQCVKFIIARLLPTPIDFPLSTALPHQCITTPMFYHTNLLPQQFITTTTPIDCHPLYCNALPHDAHNSPPKASSCTA